MTASKHLPTDTTSAATPPPPPLPTDHSGSGSTFITLDPPTFEHHRYPSPSPSSSIQTTHTPHTHPRISWRFRVPSSSPSQNNNDDKKQLTNFTQTSYEIQIRNAEGTRSFKSTSSSTSGFGARNVLVPWPDTDSGLTVRERREVRVRCGGVGVLRVLTQGHGTEGVDIDIDNYTEAEGSGEKVEISTGWSSWVGIERGSGEGLFDTSSSEDNQASINSPQFIGTSSTDRTTSESGPLRPIRFRKGFTYPSSKKITKARLYITSLGVYEAYINGQKVAENEHMSPGWTSYTHKLNYQVYDVTSLLAEGGSATVGENTQGMIAVEVGEGWFAGRLGWRQQRYFYGEEIGIWALLEIEIGSEAGGDTGEVKRIKVVSDEGWKASWSSLVKSEIYDGEKFDARLEVGDWTNPAEWFSGSSDEGEKWIPVKVLDFPKSRLQLSDTPPVRVTEEKSSVEIFKTKSGKVILDFGQNLVGKLFIPFLDLPKGHEVIFKHAEVMENGELGTRPLRSAGATDVIISAGKPIRNWTPTFTFHGFRYVQVEGWEPEDKVNILKNVTALVLHTDMERTGWFECSEPLVNRLHENAVWSMRGNFLSIPTDCPQRDERLGWTGDIQVFGPSACFLYDTSAMLGQWLEDVAKEQVDEGGIPPFVVPNILHHSWGKFPQAVWDDVVILLPWALYQAYGDVELLKKQYDSMRLWIDKGLRRGEDGLWDTLLWQLGDWLDPAAPPDRPDQARTDGTYVADAYLVHITKVMSEISTLIGENKEAKRYSKDYARVLKTFQDKYITPLGLVAADSQTGLALSIVFDLHQDPKKASVAAARLARAVRFAHFKVATGFAGTPVITHALSAIGEHQLAYRMLLEKGCPSWLYPITMGATTIWERWNSMLPDGSINPGEMTSFNHYALGSIVNWLHEVVGGISPLEPGWREFKIRPVPGGNLKNAEVEHVSPYGRIWAKWVIVPGESKEAGESASRFELEVQVPPNSRAYVVLPGRQGCRVLGKKDEGVWIGSGRYRFKREFQSPGEWPPVGIFPESRGAVHIEEGEFCN